MEAVNHPLKPRSPWGHWLPVGLGAAKYRAFVPNELPPHASGLWDEELMTRLSAADRAIGRLAGIAKTLPNPHLLIGPFKRREAILSSRIEGTHASMSELVLFEARPEDEGEQGDVLEVYNYVKALDHGLERVKALPVSKRLIREVHGILMRGVRGQERTPGEFRTSQNWIGPPGSTIATATFIPPPPAEMQDCLDRLERFLQAPSTLPPLLRLAMIHYQFEAIHPFLDGNGRVGRLLITLLMCVESILPSPLLYLSAYFEQHRQDYYAHLLRVSREGAWAEWLKFFLLGVTEQAADAEDRAARLIDLRAEYHATLHTARSSALLLRLVDHLFTTPAVSVAGVARLLRVTPRSAQGSINKLVAAGILAEVTGMARNRLWMAKGINSVVQ